MKPTNNSPFVKTIVISLFFCACIFLAGCSRTSPKTTESKYDFDLLGYIDIVEAIEDGNVNAVKYFLENEPHALDPAYVRSYYGWPVPLVFAAKAENPEIIKLLLASGADPNILSFDIGYDQLTGDANTIFHRVALTEHPFRREYKKEALKHLIEAGADVNIKNSEGYTPLHLAGLKNREDIEVLRFLIENGADVNVKSYLGYTPLAAYLITPPYKPVSVEAIKLLIDKGADTNIADLEGRTALDHAIKYSEWVSKEHLDSGKVIVEHLRKLARRPKDGLHHKLTVTTHNTVSANSNSDDTLIIASKEARELFNSIDSINVSQTIDIRLQPILKKIEEALPAGEERCNAFLSIAESLWAVLESLSTDDPNILAKGLVPQRLMKRAGQEFDKENLKSSPNQAELIVRILDNRIHELVLSMRILGKSADAIPEKPWHDAIALLDSISNADARLDAYVKIIEKAEKIQAIGGVKILSEKGFPRAVAAVATKEYIAEKEKQEAKEKIKRVADVGKSTQTNEEHSISSEPLYNIDRHTGPIESAIFLNDFMLMSGSGDGTVRVWGLGDNGMTFYFQEFNAHAPGVESIHCVSNDEGLFVSGGNESSVKLWTRRNKSRIPITTFYLPGDVCAVAMSPNHAMIAACNGTVDVDFRSRRAESPLTGSAIFVNFPSCLDR